MQTMDLRFANMVVLFLIDMLAEKIVDDIKHQAYLRK